MATKQWPGELTYQVYVRHGDYHCDGDCFTGRVAQDFDLVARFAFLLEALNAAEHWAQRGVHCQVRYRKPDGQWNISNFSPEESVLDKR